MAQPKTHYTAKELAGMPGMPGTERAIRDKAEREHWPHQPRAARGGGREYPVTTLPQATRDHLLSAHLEAIADIHPIIASVKETAVALGAPETLPEITQLKRKQVDTMNARYFFVQMIAQAEPTHGVKKAIKKIVEAIADGNTRLVAMAALANDRKGADRTLSERTLLRWWTDSKKNGHNPVAVAPKCTERLPQKFLTNWVRDYIQGTAGTAIVPVQIPAWLPYFLDEYRRPQRPDLADVLRRKLRQSMPAEIELPSYDQVRRLVNRIPEIYIQKGRLTGAEYKSLLGYAERDASGYDPMTICQVDGHSFKAYVAHPTTGAHFHPEVCGVICLTTKVLAGYSAGLAESARTVADAYRHACTINDAKPWGGVPAILEADRGAGGLSKVNADEFSGLFARIGTTFIVNETGGNPQERGAIERSNQSIWIRAAKDLVTYTGKDMDKVTRKRVYERLERDLSKVKQAGKLGQVEKTSELLLSWREFLEALERFAIEYNNTEHSALPMITAPRPSDPQGKAVRRHMTPFECWADCVTRGWEPVKPTEAMLQHLFMPHEIVTVKRCKFTLFGNKYHAYELTQWHDRQVIAAYDIHNAEQVWVLDPDERPICVAKWNGNRVHAHPVAKVDHAIMQRAQRQIKNLEKKLELRTAEARTDIAVVPEKLELPAEVVAFEERLQIKEQQKAAAQVYFDSIADLYDNIRQRQAVGQASPYEITWADDYDKSLSGGGKRVGLYKQDPNCAGRFQNTIAQEGGK